MEGPVISVILVHPNTIMLVLITYRLEEVFSYVSVGVGNATRWTSGIVKPIYL